MNKSSDTKEVVETSKEKENEIEVKSLTSICLRYFIHFVILDLLVLFLFSFLLVPVLSAILRPLLPLLKDNNLLFFPCYLLDKFWNLFLFLLFSYKIMFKRYVYKGKKVRKRSISKISYFHTRCYSSVDFYPGAY